MSEANRALITTFYQAFQRLVVVRVEPNLDFKHVDLLAVHRLERRRGLHVVRGQPAPEHLAQLVGLLSGILGVMVFTAKPVKAKSAKKTAKK